jgi:hypothetical protein
MSPLTLISYITHSNTLTICTVYCIHVDMVENRLNLMQFQYQNVGSVDPGLCREEKVDWQELSDRAIITNQPDRNVCNNRVVTTNSNFVTFIPLNLLRQLSKPANSTSIVIQYTL